MPELILDRRARLAPMRSRNSPISNKVFIVGAGFSKALFPNMPLTDELGNLAYERLKEQVTVPRKFQGGTFEEHLSRLAEHQPDLDFSDNLTRQAQFHKLSNAIAEIIEDSQKSAWAEAENSVRLDLVARLIAVLHGWRSTIVTFNYDTLIENTVDHHVLWNYESSKRVFHHNIIDDNPALPIRPGTFPLDDVSSFRLLKLHGSINWWWVSDDISGATMNRWRNTGARNESTEELAERDRSFMGRTRFIVPPSAIKSSFYTNPLTRALWQKAAHSIEDADQIFIIGYSLPRSDLVVSGMLKERVKPSATVTIVNSKPGPVQEQLERIGIRKRNIEVISGNNSVAKFIAHLENQRSAEIAKSIQEISGEKNTLVTVATGVETVATVSCVSTVGSELVLTCNDPKPAYVGLGVSESTPHAVSSLTLIDEARKQSHLAVVAKLAPATKLKIVDKAFWYREIGQAGKWLTLIPSRVMRES